MTVSTDKFKSMCMTYREIEKATAECEYLDIPGWASYARLVKSCESLAYVVRNDNVMAESFFRLIKYTLEIGGDMRDLAVIVEDPQGYIDYLNS